MSSIALENVCSQRLQYLPSVPRSCSVDFDTATTTTIDHRRIFPRGPCPLFNLDKNKHTHTHIHFNRTTTHQASACNGLEATTFPTRKLRANRTKFHHQVHDPENRCDNSTEAAKVLARKEFRRDSKNKVQVLLLLRRSTHRQTHTHTHQQKHPRTSKHQTQKQPAKPRPTDCKGTATKQRPARRTTARFVCGYP